MESFANEFLLSLNKECVTESAIKEATSMLAITSSNLNPIQATKKATGIQLDNESAHQQKTPITQRQQRPLESGNWPSEVTKDLQFDASLGLKRLDEVTSAYYVDLFKLERMRADLRFYVFTGKEKTPVDSQLSLEKHPSISKMLPMAGFFEENNAIYNKLMKTLTELQDMYGIFGNVVKIRLSVLKWGANVKQIPNHFGVDSLIVGDVKEMTQQDLQAIRNAIEVVTVMNNNVKVCIKALLGGMVIHRSFCKLTRKFRDEPSYKSQLPIINSSNDYQ